MKSCYKNCLILFMLFTAITIGQTLQTNLPVTNGIVYSMVKSGNNIFLGGNFTYAGPNTGRGVGIDPTTGNYISGFPDVNGKVNCVVSDSAGGWYIGGDFTMVGGQARNSLAHIKADKTVGSWNPNINDGAGNASEIMTITKAGSLIYVGGLFNYVGASNTKNCAAIDSATGLANSWAPQPDNAVYSIIVTPRYTYLGGAFTQFTGAADTTIGSGHSANGRKCIAQIFTGQNILTQWIQSVGSGSLSSLTDPFGHTASNPAVYTMQLHDSLLIAGGNFIIGATGTGGHHYICAMDTINAYAGNGGLLEDHSYSSFTFNEYSNSRAPASKNGPIYNIAISGDTMFVGGEFLTFAGNSTSGSSYTRNHIAAGLISTKTVLSTWDPNIPISAGSLFGTITPDLNYVSSIIVANGFVYICGNFTTINSTTYNRNNFASVGQSTGTATSWNPFASAAATTMALQGNTLYAGGQFTSLNGYTRNNLCKVNASSGTVTAWDPNVSSASAVVNTLAVSGTTVFVGGAFTTIGGQARNNLAGIDTVTGLATTWQADASSIVNCLGVSAGQLYVGGYFTTIGTGATARNYIASIDTASTAAVSAWDPNSSGVISSLVVSGSTVYTAGGFTTIGGQTTNGIAALDATTGLASTWNPSLTGNVIVLAVFGSTVYAGGTFTAIGGQSRNNIAALDASTGLATTWDPNITNNLGNTPKVDCIAINGSTVYVGGELISNVGATARNNIAAIDASTGSATPWNPNPDGYVYAIIPDPASQLVYIGGYFTNILSATSSNLGAVTNPGDAALPVELTTFTATVQGSTAKLLWTTATEVNNYGFEVERSIDKTNFSKIGFVSGAGNSNSTKTYSFSDSKINSGSNYYRLKQIDNDGQFKYSSIVEISSNSSVHTFSLNQNYPNPFNPVTIINYEIPKEGFVSLKVFDTIGREVSTLVNQHQIAGSHSITFNASNLSSGIYFYQLKSGSYNSIKKLILLK